MMPAEGVDILLVMMPPWGIINPPLGPAYLATNLAKAGFNAEILDVNITLYQSVTGADRELWQISEDNQWRNPERVADFADRWESAINAVIEKLATSSAPIIGLSVIDPNEIITARLVKALKIRCPEKTIIGGGPACQAHGQRAFLQELSDQSFDYFIIGEGEKALVRFLQAFKQSEIISQDVQVVKGDDDQDIARKMVPLDMTEIAYPTFTEFDMSHYGGESFALLWSRGCIGRCLYCKERSTWGHYRVRPVESIIEELTFLKNNYHVSNFVVYDSAVNGNGAHLAQVCKEIIAKGLKITWSAEAIALPSMSPELLQLMKKAGCHTLVYGIESGSDSVLKAMGKLSSAKTAGEAIKNTSQAGIRVAINILVGFPGEREEEFAQTLAFLKTHAPSIDRLDSVSTLQVVTDTPLWQRIEQFGVVLPEKEPHDRWYTEDKSNTWDIRQQRLQKVLSVVSEYGIEIGRTFLDDRSSIQTDTGSLSIKSALRRADRFLRSWAGKVGNKT